MARYAPAVFPLLSLCGVTVVALRSDQRRRVASVAAERAERRARRSGKRLGVRSGERSTERAERSTERSDVRSGERVAERAGTFDLGNLNAANAARRMRRDEAMTGLLNAYKRDPHLSYAAAGREVGRSKAWVAGALADLEQAGRIRRRNGNGIEVVR